MLPHAPNQPETNPKNSSTRPTLPMPFSAKLASFIRDRALAETTDALSPTADDSVSGKTTWSDD
jgi:hypothetical protein